MYASQAFQLHFLTSSASIADISSQIKLEQMRIPVNLLLAVRVKIMSSKGYKSLKPLPSKIFGLKLLQVQAETY